MAGAQSYNSAGAGDEKPEFEKPEMKKRLVAKYIVLVGLLQSCVPTSLTDTVRYCYNLCRQPCNILVMS